MINWKDPTSVITPNFKVRECLWLPKWQRLANEADGLHEDIYTNLIQVCQKMEIIRILFQSPVNVHSFFRSKLYNELIGGAPNSPHLEGQAIDFDMCPKYSIEDVKNRIRPLLERYQIRMEMNGPTATWVHIDLREVSPGGTREFIP